MAGLGIVAAVVGVVIIFVTAPAWVPPVLAGVGIGLAAYSVARLLGWDPGGPTLSLGW